MITCYYKVNISPGLAKKEEIAKPGDEKEKTDPPCIYLNFNSTNKMYENKEIRTACQLYTCVAVYHTCV